MMGTQAVAPHAARWDPAARHEMAMIRVERAIAKALADPKGRVKFTEADLQHVAELMGLRASADDTPRAARSGETSNRPSVRSLIDPAKRYRLKSTGEVITGAELLCRRSNPQ